MRISAVGACSLLLVACGGRLEVDAETAETGDDATFDDALAPDAPDDATLVDARPDTTTADAKPDSTLGDAAKDANPIDASSDATLVDAAKDANPIDAKSDASPVDSGPPALCWGKTCASGAICCYASGACFDPTNPSACSLIGIDAGPLGGYAPCGSNADCRIDELCQADTCQGVGHCYLRNNCGFSSEPVCGCNGATYPNPQTACKAGVRFLSHLNASGGCGPTWSDPYDAGAPVRILCASDANCPSGKTCCGLYGVCVDPSCSHCCQPPPAGTKFPCGSDADCNSGEYCEGSGCGTPGGCKSPDSVCNGVVDLVCGCDGKTYTNACWASNGKTRVARKGSCTDAGI
jgi:hypothetical protein